jgi:hypothetical protein
MELYPSFLLGESSRPWLASLLYQQASEDLADGVFRQFGAKLELVRDLIGAQRSKCEMVPSEKGAITCILCPKKRNW